MIIFDLDGTLADCEHRRHFVSEHHWNKLRGSIPPPIPHFDGCWKPDWKAFYEACDKDYRIEPTVALLNSIFRTFIWGDYRDSSKVPIEIWSGRCESVRQKTVEWFYRNSVPTTIKLKMRPIGDYTPDDQLKERWLDEHIAGGGMPIEMVFDDRPKVVRMCRS